MATHYLTPFRVAYFHKVYADRFLRLFNSNGLIILTVGNRGLVLYPGTTRYNSLKGLIHELATVHVSLKHRSLGEAQQ